MNVKTRQLTALRARFRVKGKLQRAESVNWASMSRLYELAMTEAVRRETVIITARQPNERGQRLDEILDLLQVQGRIDRRQRLLRTRLDQGPAPAQLPTRWVVRRT